MKVILASKSPRRRELLKRVIPQFETVYPKCREYHFKKWTPNKNAEENALRKALRVGLRHKNSLIIGSDTIVVYKNKILGKPKTMKEAEEMLSLLSGKIHEVITGVALILKDRTIKKYGARIFHVTTKVKMKKLTAEEIRKYFLKVNPLDKAGAYAIQEGPKIVERIWGSYTNVVGLPIERLKRELKSLVGS